MALLAHVHSPGKYRLAGHSPDEVDALFTRISSEDLDFLFSVLEQCKEQGIAVCTILDGAYPRRLRHISDPPVVLFVQGEDIGRLNKYSAFAVVGSRRADATGRRIATGLSKALSQRGGVIVSGLASGIDSAAHRGALESTSRLPTVAVLGHGFLRPVYPSSSRKLAEQILDQGGFILSQFLPGVPPFPVNFLNRNRVVAGISQATIIIQATARSGSLSTARHARDGGQEIFVTPGPFESQLYEGSHELIRQGATLLHSERQLIEELAELLPEKALQEEKIEPELRFRKLYSAFLESDRVAYEDLQNIVSDRALLDRCLLELELGGFIQKLPGMQYMRKG